VIIVFLSALALVAAVVVPGWLGDRFDTRFERWETALQRRGPLVVALMSIAVVWFTWDALAPIPRVHDEYSYLLQADIFARLRWTAAAPPIADFFEQPHVQVVPVVASKYPPGHALLLALGSLVGFHALVPLLLTGITAALVWALAARLTDPWTALLTWLAWLTAPLVLRFQPSYFSELTTTPLVLAAWWLLLDWRETRKRSPLLWMALAIGWGAITRQLTMLAFAIPIGVVVVRDVVRTKAWRDFALALAIGVAVLLILPLWSWRTTGDWRVSPVEQYRKDYLPFDKMGFTVDTSAPLRAVSPVLKSLYDDLLIPRRQQTLGAVPRTAMESAIQLSIALFQEARLPLALFALVGLFAPAGPLGAALRFGALSSAMLFVAYLAFPHWPSWTLYYLETVPVAAALIAVGIAWTARRISGARAVRTSLALAVAAIAVFAMPSVWKWRAKLRTETAFNRHFILQLQQLPSPRAIVFVHYSSNVVQHIAVVFNYADLAAAPVWVVHDLGPRNAELRKMAPDRASFDFDEEQLVKGLRRP
jgi:hypothetical protein